ncbi:hypothetical protein AALP_AA4G075700 [Arabis alpina]|uniref:Small ribosomal subunit protein uS15c n=1 Tax=Arabis alpina TaxID=50452 RepID=A0A087H1T5_ARAAL|nr:hypothetical protein AALP_AA4G075700 [Arabis alpina]
MAITTDHASLTFLAPRNEFPPCLLKKPTIVCISNFGPFPKPRLTISYVANTNTPVYKKEDNLSPVEKMRTEVTKLREEVKISESDCGSSSVQVVQLTSQIKHVSSSLHRKDKQSRRGLVGMVQKRKKLLKYLKRTDSDSYHLVLSKLGLRDKF